MVIMAVVVVVMAPVCTTYGPMSSHRHVYEYTFGTIQCSLLMGDDDGLMDVDVRVDGRRRRVYG